MLAPSAPAHQIGVRLTEPLQLPAINRLPAIPGVMRVSTSIGALIGSSFRQGGSRIREREEMPSSPGVTATSHPNAIRGIHNVLSASLWNRDAIPRTCGRRPMPAGRSRTKRRWTVCASNLAANHGPTRDYVTRSAAGTACLETFASLSPATARLSRQFDLRYRPCAPGIETPRLLASEARARRYAWTCLFRVLAKQQSKRSDGSEPACVIRNVRSARTVTTAHGGA